MHNPIRKRRSTKYTPETVKVIYDAVAACAPLSLAAVLAGVSRATIFNWAKGRPEFADLLKQAFAEAEGRLARTIMEAAEDRWQAAAWILERHPGFSKRWATTVVHGSQVSTKRRR